MKKIINEQTQVVDEMLQGCHSCMMTWFNA